ncbi:MAG: hypothetical protein KDD37_04270 [Bdellovibrionales bacterium]|nr:hypothetical protein [Bdellovibrionales bacterium]
MKKIVAISSVAILIYFLHLSYLKIFPAYFISIQDTEYSFDEFFGSTITNAQYQHLGKVERLSVIYERLKTYICVPDCQISVFSFDSVPVDITIEGLFVRAPNINNTQLLEIRKKVASEQYYFSKLMTTVVFINDPSLKKTVIDSQLPWIGKTIDSVFVEFIYAENLNEWFRTWILRFIRDYRKVAKIYMLAYESGEDFNKQLQVAICLKEKKIFWDPYFNENLDLVNTKCDTKTPVLPVQQEDLSIRLGDAVIYKPESYYQLVKAFQISYLSLKVK